MCKLNKKLVVLGTFLATAYLTSITAHAATDTSTFTSQITITAQCSVLSTNTLDFGSVGLLTSVVVTTADFAVQCTNGVAYSISLDAGTSAGGSIATRKMINGAATVDYNMYSDAGRTTNWGETDGVDRVTGTGNGASQTLTIYGRVPVQTSPAANAYTDTVTVTINY